MTPSLARVARRLVACLIPAVVAATLAVAAAQASSIVYVDGPNVWLTTPDGARQRQLTTDGTPERGLLVTVDGR
jgi:hypothetical protein